MSSWVSVLEQLAELDPADFDPDDLADEQLRQFVPLAQTGHQPADRALQTRGGRPPVRHGRCSGPTAWCR